MPLNMWLNEMTEVCRFKVLNQFDFNSKDSIRRNMKEECS